MKQDLIINFTPTGMIPMKSMTPHVPISVNEIVEDVHRACEIGISMVHLHAREESDGEPTYKAELFGKIIEGIRAFDPKLVICTSLSGRNFKAFEQRSEPLQLTGNLKPDMGSLTLSSMNFNRQESVNSPSMVHQLATEMKAKGIVPELEAFDLGMINYAKYLIKKEIIDGPHYMNILLGNIASAQADLSHVGLLIRDLPENTTWSLAGLGQNQLVMNSLSVTMGGGVRVGLEDNIWYDKAQTKKASNAQLIERIHRIAAEHERQLMPIEHVRKQLGLLPGDGQYGRST